MNNIDARLKNRVINGLIFLGVAIAFIGYILMAGKAKAEDYNLTIGTAGYVASHGIVVPLQSAAPHIIAGPNAGPLSDEAERRAQRWEQFCKPTPVRGDLGVIRLTYAHEGCEYGRTE